jgi:hypothetical protein
MQLIDANVIHKGIAPEQFLYKESVV